MKSTRSIELLLIEDNPADAFLTRQAVEEVMPHANLSVVQDAVEALQFLQKRGTFVAAPTPDLILLDLNLPRKDGREFLAEVKGHPTLRRIPLVVLTTSAAQDDIERAYDLQANCFITKPLDFNEFLQTIQALEHFWFSVAKLPRPDNSGPASHKNPA